MAACTSTREASSDYTVRACRREWNFAAPEGADDTHYLVMRDPRSLAIRRGHAQADRPTLNVEPVKAGVAAGAGVV